MRSDGGKLQPSPKFPVHKGRKRRSLRFNRKRVFRATLLFGRHFVCASTQVHTAVVPLVKFAYKRRCRKRAIDAVNLSMPPTAVKKKVHVDRRVRLFASVSLVIIETALDEYPVYIHCVTVVFFVEPRPDMILSGVVLGDTA